MHRANGKCPADVRQPHFHDIEFQMNYVLKGWCRFEFDGHGEQMFEAGDAWLQPPRIEHALLEFSDDFEVLEIVMPADFHTVDL
ncbi:MAG: cupin domain-containing protein [Acidiferrobacterales bacterium]|nr:cupin domain-containing protein [Acidiferrobacterales bacterium]